MFLSVLNITYPDEDPRYLSLNLKGTVCLHIQSCRNEEVVNFKLKSSSLCGNLTNPTNKQIIPVFEHLSNDSEPVFLYQLKKCSAPSLDGLRKSFLQIFFSVSYLNSKTVNILQFLRQLS